MKQQVNKNHEETLRSLLGSLFQQGYEVDELVGEVENIREQLKKLELKKT
jgi:polyhydroxyalkanoate synthesis regulator phasin